MEYVCVIVFEISTQLHVFVSLMRQRSQPHRFCVIPAGETGKWCREFPGARPACRGLLKPLQITLDVHFGREPKWSLYIDMGDRFRARTELCARKEDFGSGENRSVCAEDGYSLDDNIYVFNVGIIRVYRLKCDSGDVLRV